MNDTPPKNTRTRLGLLGATLGFLALASCASAPSGGAATTPESSQLAREVNSYRSSLGKDPIRRMSSLDQMARLHNRYMNENRGKFSLGTKNITHAGFEDRSIFASRGLGMQSVAENVAGGKISGPIAPQLVRAWSKSHGHDFNMKADWDATGVDVLIADDGMVFATQIFATQNKSHFASTERFRQF